MQVAVDDGRLGGKDAIELGAVDEAECELFTNSCLQHIETIKLTLLLSKIEESFPGLIEAQTGGFHDVKNADRSFGEHFRDRLGSARILSGFHPI